MELTMRLKLILAVLAVATLTAFIPALQAQDFQWIRTRRLTVHNDADINSNIDVSGTSNLDVVDIDGAVDMASTLAVADDATLGAGLIISAQDAISPTNGAVITPTGTYQVLTSAGTVTPTVTTTGIVTGQLLVLINAANTTINIADSGTMKLTAAGALGQYDSLTLWYDGTNWIELSRANN